MPYLVSILLSLVMSSVAFAKDLNCTDHPEACRFAKDYFEVMDSLQKKVNHERYSVSIRRETEFQPFDSNKLCETVSSDMQKLQDLKCGTSIWEFKSQLEPELSHQAEKLSTPCTVILASHIILCGEYSRVGGEGHESRKDMFPHYLEQLQSFTTRGTSDAKAFSSHFGLNLDQ